MGRPTFGGLLTLAAIACASYLGADVAHEWLGHGGMCTALGGHTNFVSTMYEDCSIRSHAIDGAGPITGIIVALLAWAWLRFAPPRGQGARVFLALAFAFAIFWNVGYMLKSGLTDQGDWAFVIAGLQPARAWHAGLTLLGVVLYVAAMRETAWLITARLGGGEGLRPFSFTLMAYLTAALLSAAGALLDPRGPSTIISDALPSSLGSVGLIWTGFVLQRRLPLLRVAAPFSFGWLGAGLMSAVLFVAVLGPGLRFS
jgi:hypothetical protein